MEEVPVCAWHLPGTWLRGCSHEYKKGYNWRLIEYGHLVLGTRSAAKFEQVPRSTKYPIYPDTISTLDALKLWP